jgi:hypothetical protein
MIYGDFIGFYDDLLDFFDGGLTFFFLNIMGFNDDFMVISLVI